MVLIRKTSQNSKKSVYSLESKNQQQASGTKLLYQQVQAADNDSQGNQYDLPMAARQPIHHQSKGATLGRFSVNTAINLKNKNVSIAQINDTNQKPRSSQNEQSSKSEDARKQEEQYKIAQSNASQLFDNSLLCCLTQSKKSKPKTNARAMMTGGAQMVKPIQPMSRKNKLLQDNSYTLNQNQEFSMQAKRALSEQQKARQLAFTTANSQKATPGMSRLSSNDSGGYNDKQSANS